MGNIDKDIAMAYCADDEEIFVEGLAESLQFLKTFLEALARTTHTYVFPHDVAELLVD